MLRVFGDAGVGGNGAWKSAPLWPVRVLTEIANVEVRPHRAGDDAGERRSSPPTHAGRKWPMDFADRDDLTNLRLVEDPQPPYRHFAFTVPDREIPDALGPAGPIRFVRVLPLTDSQKHEIYTTGKL